MSGPSRARRAAALTRRREAALRLDLLPGRLAGSAARGVATTLGGQFGRFGLQVLATVVLSRLLERQDFGLMAMTTAVLGLAQLLSELGLSTATAARQQITHAQVNALFWIQATIGVIVALLAVLLAPAVQAFYGVDQVAVVVSALAVTFALRGASAQHQALLERRLQFRRLARVELVSSAVSTAAAITVALLGGGMWALVTLNVSYVLARSLQLWKASGWRPGPPRRAAGLWSLLTFGGHLSVFNVVNYTARNADNVLIGRFVGADALGLYDRAYRLLMLPLQQVNGPVSRVAVPTLSRLVHEDARLRRYYVTAVGGVSLASMPLMAVAAVLASPLVVVVLGDQWAPAAPIFRALAIVGLVDTVAQTNGWLYSATGRTKQQAQWALISRPLVVLGFIAGLPWGPLGVAIGYAVVGIALTVPGFAWSVHGTPVTLTDISRAAAPAIVVSMATATVAGAVQWTLRDASVHLVAAASGGAAAAAYVLMATRWPPARSRLAPLLISLRSRSLPVT